MYTIIAYDKDNDVFVELEKYADRTIALTMGIFLSKIIFDDTEIRLTRHNGEPFDWLEVRKNLYLDGEELVWASYWKDGPILAIMPSRP